MLDVATNAEACVLALTQTGFKSNKAKRPIARLGFFKVKVKGFFYISKNNEND